MQANHDLAFELNQDLLTTLAASILPNKGHFLSDTPLGPPLAGTAHISLQFAALWFNLDARRTTLWRERVPGGSEYDPTKHIAIDLDLAGSKMIIDKITVDLQGTQVDYQPSPTRIVEVVAPAPLYQGTTSERTKLIPENELPLFGRLTVHDHFAVGASKGKAQNLFIDFREPTVGEAPRLIPTDLSALRPLWFGGSLDANDEFNESIVFRDTPGGWVIIGKDPRVLWEMSGLEMYWVTSCVIGLLGVIGQRLEHPDWEHPAHEYRFLDEIAAQLGDGVKKELIAAGTTEENTPGRRVVIYKPTALLPGDGLEVDPNSSTPGTVREMDAAGVYWRGRNASRNGGGLRIELRTAEPPIPNSGALQYSALSARPAEGAALSISTWMILRSLRTGIADQLCIPSSAFEFDAPCKLTQSVSTRVDSIAIHLDAFEAVVIREIPASESSDGVRVPGRIRVTGAISKETLYYGFKADFELFVEFFIDEVPQGTKDTIAELTAISSRIRTLQSELCGLVDSDERKAKTDEMRTKRDEIALLPKSIGLAPIFKPTKPKVNRDFWFTPLAYATLVAIVVVSIIGGGVLAGAAATPVAAVSLVMTAAFFGVASAIFVAMLDAILTAVLIAPMVVGGIEGITKEPPEGSALPVSSFLPMDVSLADDMAVYLSTLPSSLEVTCVKKDIAADPDRVIQYIGGLLPGDGRTWKMTVPDAVALLRDDTREPRQDFYIRLPGNGKQVSLVVAKSALGRDYVRTKADEADGNNLEDLPECPVTPA